MEAERPTDRVLTVPNLLSVIRLALIPVFIYLLLVAHAQGWAVAILMFSGASDWADGKIARSLNQSSRLGVLLDPAVDRLYMVAVPVVMAVSGIVPWWFVVTLLVRDGLLAATLPLLRSRGLSALPVTYVGKAATFALMAGFPLVLLGTWDALWSRVVGHFGWGFLIWGLYMYLWAFVLYAVQMTLVVRQMPKLKQGRSATQPKKQVSRAEPDRLLGGYDPNAGRSAHAAARPTLIPVPSLLRALLSEHLDPGYAAQAKVAAARSASPPSKAARVFGWFWQALAAALVAAVFAAAVAQARSVAPGVRTAQQLLATSVRSTEASATKLAQRRSVLTRELDDDQRRALASDAEGQRLLSRLDALSLAAASTAVIGPGLTVTITDPGVGPNLSDVSKQRVTGSRQIILDRDLQLVVNSLWASGAEAVAVGGARIGPNVTIRQAGGAILVDNNPTGSPYTILAVGPPHSMRDVFDHSPGLQRLRLLEVSYGVGVTVNVSDALSLPAGSVRDVKFAKQIGP